MLLPVAVLLISLQLSAQDLIYKRNGQLVKAKIINTTGKSLSYHLYPPADSLLYYINFTAIDSIIYQNGEKAAFVKDDTDDTSLRKNPYTDYSHHIIGFDLAAALLYKNLTFSYEFLPGEANIGFKAAFAKKVKSNNYQSYSFKFNRIPDWTARLGINFYLFPHGTFRLGTGCYYIGGKYYSDDFQPYGSYDPNIPGESKKNVNGMIISGFGFYNLTENLAINLGLDIPLFINPSTSQLNIAIRCEILYNF